MSKEDNVRLLELNQINNDEERETPITTRLSEIAKVHIERITPDPNFKMSFTDTDTDTKITEYNEQQMHRRNWIRHERYVESKLQDLMGMDASKSGQEIDIDAIGERPTKEISLVVSATVAHLKELENKREAHILLDTGAYTNIIGEKFLKQQGLFSRMTKYEVGMGPRIRLGGTSTTIETQGYINLEVELDDRNMHLHIKDRKCRLRFEVMHTEKIIIGITDLVTKLPVYIVRILQSYAQLVKLENRQEISAMDEWLIPLQRGLTPEHYDLPSENMQSGELVYPWKDKQVPAPEDEFITEEEMPTTININGMDLLSTLEQRVSEYGKLVPASLGPDIKADKVEEKEWREMMMTKANTEVFCFDKWKGLNIEPIRLETLNTMPIKHVMPSRHVNAEFKEKVHEMILYYVKMGFYIMRSSATVSGMVAVRKPNGSPRICSDFRWVNPHILTKNAFMPNIRHSMEKMRPFKVFAEMDWYKAYHQYPLHIDTQKLLAMITPWGCIQPQFLPEGVAPASAVMQETVDMLFHDVQEFTVTIADNIIIGGYDLKDLRMKTQKILDTCLKSNIILSIEKCNFGTKQISFFGYSIGEGRYTIDEKKRVAAANIEYPTTAKAMKSFLGLANFFSPFIPRFAERAAELHDMTRTNFDWKDKEKAEQGKSAFQDIKQSMIDATEVWFPDRNYTWILRTDASIIGIGGVLLQAVPKEVAEKKGLYPKEGEEFVFQPLWFGSAKFSKQAQAWSTIEQETYAVVYAVKELRLYLALRPFILETDHANILYLEKSDVPKLVRWRLYLQEYPFILRHIPGRHNIVADYYSRMETSVHKDINNIEICSLDALYSRKSEDSNNEMEKEVCDIEQDLLNRNMNQVDEPDMVQMTQTEMFTEVHNARMGHVGVQATYNNIKARFPRADFPMKRVQDMVNECIWCQKFRLANRNKVQEVRRHLHVDHVRATVCMDTLTLTRDKHGNKYLMVMINHGTKRVVLYPGKERGAEFNKEAMLYYIKNIGLHDTWWSDPGSEFDNDLNKELNQFLGINVKFTMVNRPQANGVERTNGKILDYLRPLVQQEQLMNSWSELSVLAPTQMMLNNRKNEETGYTPNELTFGVEQARYNALPDRAYEGNNLWVKEFSSYLKLLREKALSTLQGRQAERAEGHEDNGQRYSVGDFVFIRNDEFLLRHKFRARNEGPVEVMSHVNNDVKTQNLLNGKDKVYHATKCRIFIGTREEAIELARTEADEYDIEKIISHTGNPMFVRETTYKVQWKDGTESEEPYDNIKETEALSTYACTKPYLHMLTMQVREFQGWRSQMNGFRQERWASQCVQDTYLPQRVGENVWISLFIFNKRKELNEEPYPNFQMEDRVFDATVTRIRPAAKSIDVHIQALDRDRDKCIMQLPLADVLMYVRKVLRRSESSNIKLIAARDLERTQLKDIGIFHAVYGDRENNREV